MGLLDELGKTSNKAHTLATAKENKLLDMLGKIPEPKDVTTLGEYGRNEFNDADTTGFSKQVSGQTPIRLGTPELSAQGQWIDTPESPYTATHRGIYNPSTHRKEIRNLSPEEQAAYNASKMELDNYASGVVGTPLSAVQDLKQHPLTPRNQAIYDAEMQRINMSVPKMSAVGVQGHMDKSGNRQIGDFYTKQGQRIGESLGDRLLSTGNAQLRTSGIMPSTGTTQTLAEMYAENAAEGGGDNTITKAGKALESGAFNLVSRGMQTGMHGIEGIGEAIGSEQLARGARVMQKRLDQQRKDGTYDKYLGYSPAQVEEYGKKFSNKMQKGEYWEALKGLASDPESAFIAFAQSTPEMAAMMTGVGLGAVVGINVNNNLYTLEQSAAAEGRATTATEKGTSVGLSVITTLLDRLGDKAMMGNKLLPGKVTEAITTSLSKMTPTIRNEVLGQLGGRLTKAGIATGEFAGRTAMEGVTEGIQTIGENKATDVNKMNMNLSQEEIDQGLQAVGIGMGAGAVGTAGFNPSLPYTTTKESLGAVKDVTNLGLNALAKMGTDKTVGDIRGAKAQEEKGIADLTAQIDSRRVKLTEDMTPEQVQDAEAVNSVLDGIYDMDTTNPEYESKLQSNLANVDTMKNDLGFSTQPTEAVVEDTKVAPTKEVETPKAKVEYQDKAVEDSVARAGLVNILSKSDKVKEIRVEALSGDTRVSDASRKKSKIASVFNVNDDVISDVLEGKMNADMASTLTNVRDGNIVNFAKRIGGKLAPSNENVFQALQGMSTKVSAAIENDADAKTAMDNLFGDTSSREKAVRVVALVTDTVHSAMRAEYDINSKYKLSNKEVASARRQDVAHQLGKELVNSYELRLAGKPEEMAKAYIEIGENMLTIAEKAGMVESGITDVALHNMVDAEGNRLTAQEAKKYYHAGKKKGTVQVPSVKVTGIKSPDRGVYTHEVSAANTLSKLLKPINYEMPTQEPVDDVPVQADISDAHEKIIQDYNKMQYSIKPEALQLLKEVKEYIKTKYPRKDGTGDTDKALASDPMLIRLLGLQKSDAVIRKNTEGGKAIGRKGTITNLLDNLEVLEEGNLHFNYESAINQRIHVMQTILDFQGDKYIARQILQGGMKEKKTSGQARKLLVNNIADELKITPEEVENPTNTLLVNTMNTLDETGSISMKDLPTIAQRLKVKSPFKALSLIKAMSDIRKSNGGTVSTSYQVESDATASGVVNTLLNLSGHPSVQKVLKALGIGETDKGTDPYNFIAEVLENSPLYESEIKPILDELKGVGMDARNVAKYPIMKWFYGQLDANNNADMGRDIAEDLVDKAMYEYNQKSMDLINKILGSKKYAIDVNENSDLTPVVDMTEEDQQTVADFYSKNIAEEYTNALSMTFAEVGGYRSKMGDIYKMLKKTGKWDGSIRTAMDALLPTGKDYKMSVQKLKQMVFLEGNDTYTTNKMMDNETSFNVNLQHATDAALLLMSIKDILGDVVESGVMTVHDALYSDAETALKIMDKYNQYTKEAALKYDYMDTALNELKDALDKMEDSPLKKEYQATYETMKTENDALMKVKEEYLKGKELNILGDWEVGQERANSRMKGKASTDTESTVVHKQNETTQKGIAQQIAKALNTTGTDMRVKLQSLVSTLDVSEEYTELKDKVLRALGDNGISFLKSDKYEALPNEVFISPTDWADKRFDPKGQEYTADTFIATLAHEVDHAYQMGYILSEKGKNSTEVRYLQKVLEKLNDPKVFGVLTSRVKIRINYVKRMEAKEGYGVVELSAILNSEPDIATEIQAVVGGRDVRSIVKAFMDKIVAWMKSLSTEEANKVLEEGMSSDVSVENIQLALHQLDANARATKTEVNTELTPAQMVEQKDANPKEYLNPLTAINEGIAKSNRVSADWMEIFGYTISNAVGPKAAKTHRTLKHAYPIYREVVNLLRHGFYDSDFAQRMHQMLGMANDTKDKVIKEALSLFTKYQQESSKERESMAEMDRMIKEKYNNKQRIVVHQLFANTAIANIILIPEVKDALLKGEKSITQLLEEVGNRLNADTRSKLDEVAEYWVTGNTSTNAVNVKYGKKVSNNAYVYTTLKAISKIDGGVEILTKMDSDLRNWMMSMALMNKKLNDEINEKGLDYQGKSYSNDAEYHGMYDGSYSMDIHDQVYEHKAVTLGDMRRMENSEENGWKVIVQPTKDTIGVISRESLDAGRVTGVGLEMNRYVNGIFLSAEQSQVIYDRISDMSDDAKEAYLQKNKLVQDGRRYRVLVGRKTKVEKLSVIENAAHSLYRTYIHNKELVQAEAIRQLMLENGTRYVKSAVGMKELEAILRENDRKGVRGKLGEREEVEPFINIDYNSDDLKDIGSYDDLKKKYPMITKYYKIPEGLSSFNSFNSKVSLVKRGVSDVLLGHKNFSVFGSSNNRELAKYEQMFKKMVILIKQKMVVTNPSKLAMDSITNMGVLSMMDIGIVEILQGYKEGLTAYKEYAAARTKMVNLTMNAKMADARYVMEPTKENEKAKVWTVKQMDTHKAEMEKMDFHDAFNAGFIQSYSTDLVIKEFDTISGLQKDIDNFVDKYTHDKKGNPNKLFDAIKWWQNAGVGMDEVLRKMGETARVKETDVGTELIELADRLKNKKDDKESVARYVSDMVGAPSSEIVNYGSAYMVLADALSKYILAKHLMTQPNMRVGERGKRRLYTKEEAYNQANDTFVDYRTNIPHEIKALSDYGIMMFPAFWMKIQRVIAGLLRYHPVSTLGAYAVETAMGAQSANVVNQAMPLKFGNDSYQSILNNPVDMIAENPWSLVLATAGM